MSEQGSDAQMTNEQAANLYRREQAMRAAVKAEERRTAAQPRTGDDPGRGVG
jgi:hypothetical protein